MISAGLYIHIPFCARRCGYCAFATFANKEESAHRQYVEALKREMGAWQGRLRARTVFFGGGTPSLLSGSLLAEMTRIIRDSFEPEPEAEWTLEAHPATLMDSGRAERLEAWRRMGFNRLSLGVESLHPETLHRLDRRYGRRDLEAVVKACRDAGFDNVNLDLILGWPWETFENFKESLEGAAEMEPEHLSLYPLSVEEGTPFSSQGVRVDSDEQARQFIYAHESLEEMGWEHYEIANYARPGRRARHNLVYWHYEDYLGLGVSAASKLGEKSFTNVRNLEEYCRAPGERKEEEKMSPEDHAKRGLIMRLRLKEGVERLELEKHLGVELIREWESAGRLSRGNGTVRLTADGWLVSNRLFSSIL